MSSMVAISIVLAYLIHFPIFPAVAFLEYDPADISILIGTFAFGPGGRRSADSGHVGDSGSDRQRRQRTVRNYYAPSGNRHTGGDFRKRVPHQKDQDFGGNRSRSGMMGMAAVMLGANLIITPLFMGVSREMVWDLMPFIVGFNLIKAGINGAVNFFFCIRGFRDF